MLGRALTRLIDAQAGWARPFGDWLHGLVAAIFGRMVTIRSFLNGTWLGHPLHAVMTDVPIGALTVVIVLDVLGQPVGADVALVLGILAMLASAVIGFADYSVTDGQARVRATVHSTLMIVALALYLGSLALRAGSPVDRTVPIALSVVAYLVLAAGAFVGGDVAYVLGNMIDRHAFRPVGTKWAPLEVGPLPEGQLAKARLGVQNLVLVRRGETILALHDQCAHAGGPLSGGRIVDDCVECPWHQSQFELATGHRRRGPTVYDQPTYEVRAAEGGGYEARRSS
ncbi:MAG: Rieske 2Fe-2S domain-containing protein [Candidatus Limnocylindrales bacterium]